MREQSRWNTEQECVPLAPPTIAWRGRMAPCRSTAPAPDPGSRLQLNRARQESWDMEFRIRSKVNHGWQTGGSG